MKNKNFFCIAPSSLLFSITFGPALTLTLLASQIIILLAIIIRAIRNRKNNKKITDENFWKYFLWFITILSFGGIPFVNDVNERLYLSKYAVAFAVLFIGLIILRRKKLLDVKPLSIILTGITLIIFSGAFLYKSYLGGTKEALLPATDS